MKRMSLIDAYKIATMYDDISELSEDDLTEYIDALQYLIDNDPYCPGAWFLDLGNAYDSIEKYELAVKYYSIGIDKGEMAGYIGLGNTYRHIHEYAKAYDCYKKALDAGYPKARKLISRLKEETGYGFN